ncbi:MAG: ABC transporter permease [SAR324 cluster bacterium]|uniref:Transport permease protein n=1 Tax=SAR324 cluster bacterium TaxID=2024889 RepID=A0A7X9FT93_9DELT|nr:ABC transporter permease [SAR324 cluster bacterium]
MVENLKALYRYRALISALVVRHLSSRYRGSILGFLWSILNPLFLMLVYTLVFRYYMRFDQPNYAIFLFVGLLPWLWFASALQEATSSIAGSGHLITKSMFPAHVLPLVSILVNFVNFLLSLPLLFIFMLFSGLTFHWTLLLLPLVLFLQLIFLYGASLALSSLNVYFRDVQHLLGNILTFVFFLCPIIYPPEAVPAKLKFTLVLNPLAAMTTFYHDLILEGKLPPLNTVVYVCAWIGMLLIIGHLIYERYKESFAEAL